MDSVVTKALNKHRNEVNRKDIPATPAGASNGNAQQIHDSPATSREEIPKLSTQTSYFRSNHNVDKPSKRKQQSGSSAFTSGSLEEEDLDTPGREIETARPFRGPFTHKDSHQPQEVVNAPKLSNGRTNTTPQGTPAERKASLPDANSTPVSPTPSADRPSLSTRTTSAAFFFNRLSTRTPNAPSSDAPGPIERPMETLAEDEASTPQVQTPRAPLSPTTSISGRSFLGRSRSGDQLSNQAAESPAGPSTAGSKGWTVLKNRIKANDNKGIEEISKALSGHELVSELTTGLLPVMMLKMGLTDRDEHGERRIPILMNYLKLRITDSVYPFHNTHALFRIELQYGDGLMKWVIYREMRDFVNLHAHYRFASIVQNDTVILPSFPKTSLPYFNVLKRERGDKEVAKADFARLQRESLENYLLKLIRCLMFRPEANRLCRFLEISSLAVELATQGGSNGKQGYMRVMSRDASRKKLSGFHPFAMKARHEPKWFLVRDSYIVSVDEPSEVEIWDVFLIDQQFAIERPKRLYRQGLNKVKETFDREGQREKEEEEAETDAFQAGHPSRLVEHGQTAADPADPSTAILTRTDPEELAHSSNHTFYVRNSQRKMKLVAKTVRQMDQFVASIERMATKSIWAGKNRFESFAPIRLNVACQWLVDGRDYYWNLSRAVSMAKRTIYIHDWWISPELYLRRPPVSNPQWRLDRLLKRKAEEGVKICIILYKEVAQSFTPVDSTYAKSTLQGLHPNIVVQRSPDAEAKSLLWSHHEKLCVIDETIAFMGGFDLCFGRWDTPDHSLVDDVARDSEEIDQVYEAGGLKDPSTENDYPIWPGKDYANSRASDFHNLNRPFEDMYDRKVVPRQPWHDVGLQIVGQPARDLCRHFAQRWNYLLRIKNHTRVMPFLLPPADFTPADIEKLRIVGTCEAQICRSAGPWSMGTPKLIEHSIQNAYIKAIELSEAFVYIENQYFSTSTIAENVAIENKIGDAIVNRILRAHQEGTPWMACIIIPLTPGYPMPMDSPDAGAVRMIMEAQARSMYRGEHSIFARLRRVGIDPGEYINFFSLRAWGKMKTGHLCSQDIYIHDKVMIVDDRVVIIGSANINERSMSGDRDSELACVIRDTDMIDSVMAGVPFKVGRFAHSMRIRLMREHIGVDVDAILEEKFDTSVREAKSAQHQSEEDGADEVPWDPEAEQVQGANQITSQIGTRDRVATDAGMVRDTARGMMGGATQAVLGGAGGVKGAPLSRLANPTEKKTEDVDSRRHENPSEITHAGESLEEKIAREHTAGQTTPQREMGVEGAAEDDIAEHASMSEDELQKKVGRSASTSVPNGDVDRVDQDKWTLHSPGPKYREKGPKARGLKLSFAQSQHSAVSLGDSNTDNGSDVEHRRTFSASTRQSRSGSDAPPLSAFSRTSKSHPYTLPFPVPDIDPFGLTDPLDPRFYKDVWQKVAARNTEIFRKVFRCTPDDKCLTWTQFKEWDLWEKRHAKPFKDSALNMERSSTLQDGDSSQGHSRVNASEDNNNTPHDKRHRTKLTDEGFSRNEIELMENLLSECRGNLVMYPVRFLESEAMAGNNLFSRDRIQPMAVYD